MLQWIIRELWLGYQLCAPVVHTRIVIWIWDVCFDGSHDNWHWDSSGLLQWIITVEMEFGSFFLQVCIERNQLYENFKIYWNGAYFLILMRLSIFKWVCLFGVHCPNREFFTHMETSPLPVEGLQIFTYARHSWPLRNRGSFACHTYCDTGHPFIMDISEDPWHSHFLPSVLQWSCYYLFLRARSVTAGRPNLPLARQTL